MLRINSPLRWLAVCALAGGCSVLALSGARDQAEGEEPKEGCVKPAGGPVVAEGSAQAAASPAAPMRMPTARVGQKAPDFEASGYVGGAFKNVKLSDYAGKWVALCFYPGDFTFV